MAHHKEQDIQKLHEEAVKLLQADPALLEREAKERMVIAEEAFQKKAGVFSSPWGKQVLDNMQRMATDEEYRKEIAKRLS
jgi:hypothetical protein